MILAHSIALGSNWIESDLMKSTERIACPFVEPILFVRSFGAASDSVHEWLVFRTESDLKNACFAYGTEGMDARRNHCRPLLSGMKLRSVFDRPADSLR